MRDVLSGARLAQAGAAGAGGGDRHHCGAGWGLDHGTWSVVVG